MKALALPALSLCLGLPQDRPAFEEMTPAAATAVENGLDFLARNQARDGSWSGQNRVAKTALACMAFLASGSAPHRGPHAQHVSKGLAFILDCANRRRGHITDWKTNDWSDVHNHGYGLLFLALVYGLVQDPSQEKELREAIEKGIALGLKAQTNTGGWGYSITIPNHNGMKDEGSCTITQIHALRACREAGFLVPREPIEKAVDYIRKCAHKGGFYYALDYNGGPIVRLGESSFVPASKPRFAITAAAVSVLNAYGAARNRSSPEQALIDGGLEYLLDFIPRKKEGWDGSDFYYYGNFYAVMAMMAAGGERWRAYWPAVRDELLRRRSARGIWEDEKRWGYADEYSDTAFALLILQAPFRQLPIYVE